MLPVAVDALRQIHGGHAAATEPAQQPIVADDLPAPIVRPDLALPRVERFDQDLTERDLGRPLEEGPRIRRGAQEAIYGATQSRVARTLEAEKRGALFLVELQRPAKELVDLVPSVDHRNQSRSDFRAWYR